MANQPPELLSVSAFKATCLAVLERVRRTGRPVLITKHGRPLAEVVPPARRPEGGDWLGSMRDSARIRGDIVAPASDLGDWEVLHQ